MTARVLVVDDVPANVKLLEARLSAEYFDVLTAVSGADALAICERAECDVVLLDVMMPDMDGFEVCRRLKGGISTHHIPVVMVTALDQPSDRVRGLEAGVNDYLTRPIDKNELMARVRTQIRKKRYTERLRDNVQMSIEMAITDALTGLYNRRYMESHIGTLVEQAATRGKPLTVLVLDIDFFKTINDSYGHDAGDDVLREFAIRIKKSIRGIDLACRYGGEEFVVVMPETDLAVSTLVAERLRRRIASQPFAIRQGARQIEVTISIGIAALGGGDDAAMLVKRADQALFRAKRDGRNRVVPVAA